MTTKTTPHGQRLRDRRLQSDRTIAEAYADLRALLPRRYQPSITTLQRMETETPEEKWDGMVVTALAHLYRCRISELSPMVAAEHEEVSGLVSSSSPWIAMPGQQQMALVA
jgi:hypothetical protein